MKILKYSLLSLIVIALLLIVFPGDHREDYEEYLRDHPYHPSNFWRVNVDEIPKRDRPDLAWHQNFLMTMDPALKRPAPERLNAARQRIKEHFSSSARTGTEAFPWIERGPDNVGGRTRAIAWDPNDPEGKKVWAGGVTGGLWYTTDIYDPQNEWIKIDDFWANISITAIAFDPTNPAIVYAGTGEGFGAGAARGAGIWKSTDGGSTWSQLPASTDMYYVNDLVVRDESGTGVLYAGTHGNYYEGDYHGLVNQGLMRSTNGGISFTQVMPQIPGESIYYAISDIEIGADNKLWVGSTANSYAADNRGGGSILFSTNGTSWTLSTQRPGAERVEIACAPSNANVVYALIEGNGAVKEVLKTTNAGNGWSALTKPEDADEGIPADDFTRGQAWYDLILAVDPNDANVVLAGGIDLFKSSNGGTSWVQLSHWWGDNYPYVHADQHAIVYKPGSSTDVVFGHDGGIDLSVNINAGSPAFINRNNNYNVTQFYACAIHPDAGSNYFLAGAQDNGTQRFNLAGLGSTDEVSGGDGAYCFIDQQDGDYQITSYVYNSYYLSTNGGTSFEEFVDDQYSGQFINPSDYDDNMGILYTAATDESLGRFRNIKNGSPSRSDISVDLGEIASHIRVSPHTTSSTTLYVGTVAGRLFKITNANLTPNVQEITGSNFPAGNISCVDIGASEDELLVTFSNYGVASVYESKNGGGSWTIKEGDLQDMPVRWALYNPTNRKEVILATELGVWRTTNFDAASPNWSPSNIGLANVRVDMLQIRESDNEVIAATHGRGLYSSSGFTSGNVTADFTASVKSILADESVTFTDNSTGDIVSWEWTFEGGTPATSTDPQPAVTYSTIGSFDVTLTVTDDDGNQDTKTEQDFISVVSNLSLPNLALYKPPTWGDAVIIATAMDQTSDAEIITSDDPIYIAYSLGNYGDQGIEQNFNVIIQIDDELVTTDTWENDPADPFPGGFYKSQININAGPLAVGEHTLSITWDPDNAIEESNEQDNVVTKNFYVEQPGGTCSGEVVLTASSGSIQDGSGPNEYLDDLSCTWIIQPANATSIELTFLEFDLEEEYDFLYIYAGDDLDNPVAVLTGSSLPENIVVNSGSVLLWFESDDSNLFGQGGWKLTYTSTTAASEVPESPADLRLNVVSSSTIDLSWMDNSDTETGFVIERSLDNENFIALITTEADATSYSDTELEASTTYYYRLKAQNAIGDSEYSNVAGATTPSATLSTADVKYKMFEVYPVPAEDVLNIKSLKNFSGATYTLIDVSGKTVRSGKIADELMQLDIADASHGTYQLILKTGKETHSFRVLIQK